MDERLPGTYLILLLCSHVCGSLAYVGIVNLAMNFTKKIWDEKLRPTTQCLNVECKTGGGNEINVI